MGIVYPKMFTKVISIMPSYNEETEGELKKLTAPTLISWCRQDQMHNWTKWKTLAKNIPNRTENIYDLKPEQGHSFRGGGYHITIAMCKFLTGIDPVAAPKKVTKGTEQAVQSTGGK